MTEAKRTELSAPTSSADSEMEAISDKIRRGEPVGIMDGLAAIAYQAQKPKPLTLWQKVVKFILPNAKGEPQA